MNPDTTPTPRTDAARPQNHDRITSDWVHYSICGMLERELAEKTNEVARLRKYIEKLEIYSPENEWSQPEWRKLIGSKEAHEDPEILFKLYQFRLAPAPEEPTSKESLTVEPEWRIKSPKEYIENGDEYERNYFWLPVPIRWVGQLVEVRKPKIRTRRPLPKQYEMPLEGDIASIEWSCAHTARAIRYLLQQINTLRDEIQKLKNK